MRRLLRTRFRSPPAGGREKRLQNFSAGDGKEEFAFRLDTVAGKGSLTPHHPSVIAVQTLVKVKGGWVARIRLRKIS